MSTCDFSHPEVLSDELERRGLGRAAANAVAWLLVARHPFACRVGVPAFSRELMRRGLEPAAAHSAALMLVGLEMFDGGHLFEQVLRALARLDTRGEGGRAEALEASQLHRRLQSGLRCDESFSLRQRLELAGLVTAGLLILARLVFV